MGACPPLLRSGAGRRVEMGLKVEFGSDSKPGSVLVRVIAVFTDLRAIKEIKIPAPNAVISKIKYSGIFLILFNQYTRKLTILK